MASKSAQQVTFEIDKVIQPIYTGGDVSISADGQVLATCVEEEALLTNPETGEALCRIEGVRTARHVPMAVFADRCSRMARFSLRSKSHRPPLTSSHAPDRCPCDFTVSRNQMNQTE